MNKARIVFIILIVALMLSASIFQYVSILSFTDSLLSRASALDHSIHAEKWAEALLYAEDLSALLNQKQTLIYSLTDHTYFSDIEKELCSISADLHTQNYPQLPAASARLKQNIEILRKTERLSISSIF